MNRDSRPTSGFGKHRIAIIAGCCVAAAHFAATFVAPIWALGTFDAKLAKVTGRLPQFLWYPGVWLEPILPKSDLAGVLAFGVGSVVWGVLVAVVIVLSRSEGRRWKRATAG